MIFTNESIDVYRRNLYELRNSSEFDGIYIELSDNATRVQPIISIDDDEYKS